MKELSISRQCELLGIRRSTDYYEPFPKDVGDDVALLQAVLDVLTDIPFYGYRKVAMELRRDG